MEEHIRKYKSYNNAKDVEEPLLQKDEKEQILLKVDNAYLRNQQTQNINNLNHYNTNQITIKSITTNKGFIFLSSLTMTVYIFIVYVLLTYN